MTKANDPHVSDARAVTAWKPRAIFLSSTFADMHEERSLAAQDPGNAGWQRDLVVSYYTLATTLGEPGNDKEATEYWNRCHATLQHMQQAGMYLDAPLKRLLAQLGKSTTDPASAGRPPRQYTEDENIQSLTDLNEKVEEGHRQGQYEEALALAEQAHQLMEEMPDLAHPTCGQCLNNLGVMYTAVGRLGEAQTLLLEALDLWEQKIFGGARHHGYAESLYNLGDLYQMAGYLTEAEPLLKQALAVMRAARGDDHPDTLHVKNGLENLQAALRETSSGDSPDPDSSNSNS